MRAGFKPTLMVRGNINKKMLSRENSLAEPENFFERDKDLNMKDVVSNGAVDLVDEIETLINLNESPLLEQENLIKHIKEHIEKNNELPPTTLDFYKFVKLIGKGAFGKVTLGVHKLTGK